MLLTSLITNTNPSSYQNTVNINSLAGLSVMGEHDLMSVCNIVQP